MKTTIHYCGSPITLLTNDMQKYRNGATAVRLLYASDGTDFATLSVNLPGESENLPEGAFFVKHWTENEEIVPQLVKQGVIVPVPGVPPVSSGFVSGIRAYRLAE